MTTKYPLVLNGTTIQELQSGDTITGLSASDVGLGNVENKSSTTIRGEITSGNVTAALGYTPPTPTGTGASGTWGISVSGSAASASVVPWSGITSKPTTLSGYGITDAQAALGYTPPTPTGTGASGTWGISVSGSAASASSVTWSGVTGKPTTLSGYGITDAQAALVSGTSIKTVNSTTVLGSGDILVAAQKGDASTYGGAKFSLSGTTLTITTI